MAKRTILGILAMLASCNCPQKAEYILQENGLKVPVAEQNARLLGGSVTIGKDLLMQVQNYDRNCDEKIDLIFLRIKGKYPNGSDFEQAQIIDDEDLDGIADKIYIDLFDKEMKFANDGIYDIMMGTAFSYYGITGKTPKDDDLRIWKFFLVYRNSWFKNR